MRTPSQAVKQQRIVFKAAFVGLLFSQRWFCLGQVRRFSDVLEMNYQLPDENPGTYPPNSFIMGYIMEFDAGLQGV